jgi:maleylpyruvate isomerase
MRTSTAALLAGLEAATWTDEDVQAPSLLPGWTRAHVLTHLARNADGIARTLSGTLRGEIVARYPLGMQGRDADIEEGAARSSAELVADVRESAERLDRIFGAVADADGWQLPTEDRPAGDYAAARWREVEVHRVDLAGRYSAADWSTEFVSYLLPVLLAGLSERTDQPLGVEITPEDSVAPELSGVHRSAGVGDRVEVVSGPDWAVLAWLVGRPQAAQGALSIAPELRAWI